MSKSLKTIAASILALIIASPALGKMPYPGFERDMALAFENDGEPMELALLSEKEMEETKGALIPLAVLRTVYGGISGAFSYFMFHDLYPSFDGRGVFRHFVYGGAIGAMSTSPLAGALATAGIVVIAKEFDPDYR